MVLLKVDSFKIAEENKKFNILKQKTDNFI